MAGETIPGKAKKEKSRSRRFRNRRVSQFLLLLVLPALLILLAAICCLSFGLPAPIQARIDIRPDKQAVNGTLHAGAGDPVGEENYWVLLNQLPTHSSKSRTCNIEFENPAENHYNARLSLYLGSTGQYLGGTRRVDPGQYVETIELNQDLSPGEHPVLAKIELFTGTKPAGELTLEITIRITDG